MGRLLIALLPDPEAMGLLALMLLQDSRREARVTPSGDLILLEEQDRALWNQEQARAILLSSALQPQEGKDYELWLIRGDKKIPAGLLEVAGGQPTIAQIDPALLREGRPDALAVTIEPAGGMPQPTGPIVLLGKLA